MNIKSIKSFIQANRLEVISLVFILTLGLLVRLFRIDQYLTFLGDEGRDVRIVRDLLGGNLVFIGPQTSIGNMYLGPLYYYMMAPALWLSRLSPVGPAVMNALIGVFTVALTWWVGRTWFNPRVGIIAALLFSLSPIAIIYSHSSWNPNPMPLFALLCIWGTYKFWQDRNFKFIPFVAVSLAFALNMHYLGLLLIPVLGFFWLLTFKSVYKQKTQKTFLIQTALAALAFFLLMSPLLLFDLKHNFMNFNAFKLFFTDRQTTINFNPGNSNRFLPVIAKITQDLILSTQDYYPLIIGLVFLALLAFFFIRTSSSQNKKPYFLLMVWLAAALLGLGLYKQHVYAHYFGFIYPLIYLLLGLLFDRLVSFHPLTKLVAYLSLYFLVYLAVINSPLNFAPNRQLQRTEAIVDLIIEQADGQPFNFGLIAKQNYDESYRYFLENKHANLVRGEEGITDQLFVVCEDGDDCQPEGNPAWQIAIFGPAATADTWQVDHIKVYRLIHK